MANGTRKTKYTTEVIGKIEQALKLGATRRMACQYAGISEDTFARYLKEFAAFADMVNNAEGTGAIQWLAKIEMAANNGNWQAAAWKLERRYPMEYGRTAQLIEHSGNVTAINFIAVPARDDTPQITDSSVDD